MTTTIPNFRIDNMNHQHYAKAYDLHVAAHQDFAMDWSQFNYLVNCHAVRGLVCYEQNDLVGYLIYDSDLMVDAVHIAWFGTDPCWRELGVAKALIERLKMDVIFHSTFKRITCNISEANNAAYETLRSHGFKCHRVTPVTSDWDQLSMVFTREPQRKLTAHNRFHLDHV